MPSSASSPGPGSASAEACGRSVTGPATVNVRAIGATAVGSARADGDGTCWWKENTADAAWLPAGSWAGWSSRVTRTPGISTSEIPAPGYPRWTRRAPAIVMRSQLVRPGTTFSRWIAPVAATGVVTLPAAVDTRSRLAISRVVLSSSRRIPMLAGRSARWRSRSGSTASPATTRPPRPMPSPSCRRRRWPGPPAGCRRSRSRTTMPSRWPRRTIRPRSGARRPVPAAAAGAGRPPGRAGPRRAGSSLSRCRCRRRWR